MTFLQKIATAALALSLLLASGPDAAVDPFHRIEELNYYEWTAVAPIVLAGTSLGETGRYLEFDVKHVFRGDVEAGGMIRIALRRANRERRRSDYSSALKMPLETDFLVVLKAPLRTREGLLIYPMARSVSSARELPDEAQQGVLDAIAMFVEVQNEKDDRVTWQRMGDMLEQTNPLVLATALQQFAKFRRGTTEHLFSLRPLFDHPAPAIREAAAEVAGQIVERHAGEELPEEEALMAELIGVARRDETVEPRVAATRALASFGVQRVEAVLEEIARTDPDQNVRYSAERILLEHRKAREAEARRPRLERASH